MSSEFFEAETHVDYMAELFFLHSHYGSRSVAGHVDARLPGLDENCKIVI